MNNCQKEFKKDKITDLKIFIKFNKVRHTDCYRTNFMYKILSRLTDDVFSFNLLKKFLFYSNYHCLLYPNLQIAFTEWISNWRWHMHDVHLRNLTINSLMMWLSNLYPWNYSNSNTSGSLIQQHKCSNPKNYCQFWG